MGMTNEEYEQAMSESSDHASLANLAWMVDQTGVEWLLNVLPVFMENPVEIQKVGELLELSRSHTYGKGVKL